MREYYDLWDDSVIRFSRRAGEGAVRRRLVHTADHYLFTRNVRRLFVLSETVRRRYAAWPELKADVLYPPAPPRHYRVDDYEPYLFTVFAVHVPEAPRVDRGGTGAAGSAGIRAVLAGDGENHAEISALVRARGLSDRVSLPGRLDERALVDHLARCRAVVLRAFDEDFGFVTVEAFARVPAGDHVSGQRRPRRTGHHGVSGFVVRPRRTTLRARFRRLIDDRDLAARLGTAGRRAGRRLTWPATVKRLLL